MPLTLDQAKARVDAIFAAYASASTSSTPSLLPANLTDGKMYEAWVLSVILEKLHLIEGYDIQLVNSSKVVLKTSGGPINPAYPHFVLSSAGLLVAEVWTDVEFVTMSHQRRGSPPISPADYHELDIVVVPIGTTGRPRHDEVLFAIECKHSAFTKAMARAALGVRRELSLLTDTTETVFSVWPRSAVPAHPPSVFSVYSSDPGVAAHDDAGQVFGVDFEHLAM